MKLSGAVLFSVCFFAIGFTFALANYPNKHRTSSPTAKKQGGIEQAMQQSRDLMNALQRNNWNRWAVDQRLLRLPDQDIAETAFKRRPEALSFSLPVGAPYEGEVAFYSSTYVRHNFSSNSAMPEGIATAPSGFFVVGFTDGRVMQVPVGDVRMLWDTQNSHHVGKYVFPGMSSYSPGLPKFPGL